MVKASWFKKEFYPVSKSSFVVDSALGNTFALFDERYPEAPVGLTLVFDLASHLLQRIEVIVFDSLLIHVDLFVWLVSPALGFFICFV